jgi:hypothetical protein
MHHQAVRCMTHQFDVSSAQIDGCLSGCVRARVIMMENDSSSTVSFPYFSEDFWQQMICQILIWQTNK